MQLFYQIINANVTSDGSKVFEILNTKGDIYITFTYSVFWHVTNKDVSERGGESHFAHLPIELEIHWLSIINSFVLVILLTGFLAIILLRILKSDFARYAKDDEEDGSGPSVYRSLLFIFTVSNLISVLEGLDTDDYGWKLIHGDVFRFPTHRSLFSSFVGFVARFHARPRLSIYTDFFYLHHQCWSSILNNDDLYSAPCCCRPLLPWK
jgi:hypothetical protein